jgi:heat shock protein HspQ
MEMNPDLEKLFESADEKDLPRMLKLMGLSPEVFESYVSEQGLEEEVVDREIRQAVRQIRAAFKEVDKNESEDRDQRRYC